ncbi:hypothetical protein DL765_009952 [Monosporascus sp. GIB2]|nr:hypothetical protein DL765_009952 [Monosporascus sp. GIB2]
MRLINTSTYELREFFEEQTPYYAILSHTWGDEEVGLRDMLPSPEAAKSKAGFTKIRLTCEQARQDGLDWAWVDT